MEREIKFRAWDNVEKEMLDTVEKWNRGWNTKSLYVDQQGHVLEHTDEHGVCDMHFYLQGKPKYTLMQFTGLKDKNGKEIYEGDIVTWVNDKGEQVGQVTWTPARFHVRNEYNWFVEIDLTEVIGNIYENPELISPTNGEGE